MRRRACLRLVAIFAGASAVMAIVGLGISRLEVDSSIRSMMVDGAESYAAHEAYKREFGSDEILSIAIPFADPLSNAALRKQFELIEALESHADVVAVEALAAQDDVFGRDDQLSVQPLIAMSAGGIERKYSADATRARIAAHPVWSNWLVAPDLSAVALHVELADSPEALLRRAVTLDGIEADLIRVMKGEPFYFAGHPFMKREISASISADFAHLLPISMAVMSVVIFGLFRSVAACCAVFVTTLSSVVTMLGLMGVFGIGLTALSNASPAILIAISTAMYLHVVVRFFASSKDSSRARALDARRSLVRPVALAALTTSAGYASLTISSVPIVRGFGISLAVGVAVAGVFGLSVLPFLLGIFSRERVGIAHRSAAVEKVLFSLLSVSVARPALVVMIGFVLVLFAALAVSQIEVDSSGPRRFSKESRYSQHSAFYRKKMSGDVVEVVYLACEEGCFTDPNRLERLRRFISAATELPALDKAISPLDFLARTYWVLRGEQGDPQLLPDTAEAVSQLLLLYESSADQGALDKYISPGRDRVRVVFRADVESSAESTALHDDLVQLLMRFLPEATGPHSVVSTEMLLSQAADVVVFEQARSFLLAIAMILTVVAVVFRDVEAAVSLVLPNLLPLGLIFGGMSVLGIALSDSTALVAAATIGIAVDGSVHLLFCARAARAAGASPFESVAYSISTAGRAVVVTSVAIVAGFLVLLGSEFRSIGELGGLTALTMVFCLIADLVVLPAQLVLDSAAATRDDGVLVLGREGLVAGSMGRDSGASDLVRMKVFDGEPSQIPSDARILSLNRGDDRAE